MKKFNFFQQVHPLAVQSDSPEGSSELLMSLQAKQTVQLIN